MSRESQTKQDPMTAEGEEEFLELRCCGCGKVLDEYSGWQANPEWTGETRFVPYCRNCMEDYYEELAQKSSPHMALFYCCIAFNIPFMPDCLSGFEDMSEPWKAYLENLRRNGARNDNDEPLCFFDGVTDILKIFGGTGLSTGEFSKAISAEKAVINKQPGTKNQRKNWGTLEGYTTEDYKELDRLFAIHSKPFEAGGMDMETEYNLREICKLLLKYSTLLSAGKTLDAQRVMSIVETIKSSNLLRKRDEKPPEAVKIDTLMDQLEKHHLAKGGKLLGREETLKVLQGNRPHYKHSFDVVDQMLLQIINAMRRNDGMGELTDLPEDLRFEPAPGEFQEEEATWEEKRRDDLEMIKMHYPKGASK